ncbi:MAG: hypothetical protein GF307_08015 [candidate division Zixibacteria bacterium]|nr:hypothetical protein [candidate division Zixibacteria bacterium]
MLIAVFYNFYLEPVESEAVPAFARKYRMSCTTCHAPFPRLKEYGDEFAGNGFVLADQDAPRYFVDTGDEDLDLIRDIPLAFRLEGFLKYQSVTEKDVDLSTPYNLKLISGGSLTEDVAYYFYFYISERGEVAGIEDAYFMLNNLFNSELDFYFGQFQVSDPLFKRELRLTYDDYLIYKYNVGHSDINLAYDKGIMLTYGFETGTDLAFELVNGNGIVEADDFKTFDKDKYKCFAGRISQGIGDYIRVGGFGYYGKEDPAAGVAGSGTNEVTIFGPDATLAYEPLELNFQYLERRDSDPAFQGNVDDDIITRGIMSELIFMPHGDRSKWYAVGLFNYLETDLNDYKYTTGTLSLGHVFRTNIRFFVEYTYDVENEEHQAVSGFVLAM